MRNGGSRRQYGAEQDVISAFRFSQLFKTQVDKTVSHLIDEGSKAVIEGLDLLLFLHFDSMNVWIQVKLHGLQEAPVCHDSSEG